MTCAHVLGLIDAGPFADYPRLHLEAAWQHARECATCGRALRMATALPAELAALEQPVPSPDMTAIILARISQVDEPRPADVGMAMSSTRPLSSPHDRSAWAAALGALAVGVVVIVSMLPSEAVRINFAAPAVEMKTGLVAMSSTPSDALVVAAGLIIYAAGLFGPLSSRSRS
jgi:hypothetical protein